MQFQDDGSSSNHGRRVAAREICEANGASDMGSISLTSSGQSLMRRAEHGSCGSGSSFSCTQSDSSSGSSDYGPALDDGSSESNDGDSTMGGVESRKGLAANPANMKSKLTHAVLAAQEVERAVTLKEDELMKNTANTLSNNQKKEAYGDAENGSRDSQSNQGSRSGSGTGSDSNEDGQTAGERTGSGSNSSTEVTEASVVGQNPPFQVTGTKANNHHKTFTGDTSSSDGGSKINDRTDQHGLSSDLTSGSTSGSGGENSSTRSSPNRAPRSAVVQNNSNNSISSNSNNNSDKNSDTYAERTEDQFWNLSGKPMTSSSLISNNGSTEISLSSNNGKKAKKNESRNCKSDTITSSSDSGSALLKVNPLPDNVNKKEAAASSSSISLTVYRRALQQAVEGLPIDADEALALEEIIAENQLLAKNSKSSLLIPAL